MKGVPTIIKRLHVQRPDGPPITVNHNLDTRLRLWFTGGTDDPSIEIRLSTTDDEPRPLSSYIILKFAAFVSDSTQQSYGDRKVVAYIPTEEVHLEEALAGPNNFSDALYDLRWDYDDRGPHLRKKVTRKLLGDKALSIPITFRIIFS